MTDADPTPALIAPVLAVRHARKTFARHRALDDVSIEVASGEMVALIGPSGSGKSTLLRAISGLTVLDEGAGEVVLFGEVTQARGRLTAEARRVRAGVGFIFQQFNLVGRLDLYTNAALGSLGRIGFWRGLLGWWPAEIRDLAMRSLARVGVAQAAGQRANTLSGGQQQRGAIARSLVQRARLMLADEPVASLDPVSARRVMDILRALNQDDGLTVLVTLHQVDYALRYCDRVVALRAGTVSYDGPTSGLTRERLAEIYGPQFEDANWQGVLA